MSNNKPCGSLDRTSDITQQCFPADGSQHFVCCTGIQVSKTITNKHGTVANPIFEGLKSSNKDINNLSWCTSSERICTEQLSGHVSWNMNGKGYKGVLGKVFDDASKKDMPIELPLSILFMVFVLVMTVYIAWFRTAKKSISEFKNRRI